MSKKQKKMLYRIVIAFILFIIVFAIEHGGFLEDTLQGWLMPVLCLVPYLIIGYDIIWKALRNIRKGQVFDENFLMMIATFGAFAIEEYLEAVGVMLFYQIGELFQSYAVGKSRQSISDMMNICPEYANIEQDGELVQVDPDDVEIGTVIVIKAGERIPLDGIVVEGESLVDTSALTGESVPRRATVGQEIHSGCVNGSGTVKVKVTSTFENSTVARILELVENASSHKAKVENFITRFARYYTPIVTIGAVLLAVIPTLFVGDFVVWLQRACIFLVISCPCALVISVPMGFFGGIGAASKHGILVKGSNYLEAVSEMTTIVMDKTGTLTKGEFKVTEIYPATLSKEELLEIAAHAEGYSNHPIAISIREAYGKSVVIERVSDTEELAGHGIHTYVEGREVLLGNEKLMKQYGIEMTAIGQHIGTVVYVACDGQFAGTIVIADVIKEGAVGAIQRMKQLGVKKCVMLTGDNAVIANAVANELGLDEVCAELLPQDKVTKVEALLANKTGKEKLAFVGDGINDAPVLTRADIGIAMGSMGADAAIEAADIVLMDDDIRKISTLVKISRKTVRIVKQNIVFALGVKLVVLILGALGFANMWAAVFADVGVSVLAILNSMRTLGTEY